MVDRLPRKSRGANDWPDFTLRAESCSCYFYCGEGRKKGRRKRRRGKEESAGKGIRTVMSILMAMRFRRARWCRDGVPLTGVTVLLRGVEAPGIN